MCFLCYYNELHVAEADKISAKSIILFIFNIVIYSRTSHIRPSKDLAVVETKKRLDNQRSTKTPFTSSTTSMLLEQLL